MNRVTILALSMTVLTLACGAEPKRVDAPSQPMEPPPPSLTSADLLDMQAASPSIAVSEEIARACSLHFDDVGKAPKFEFNKSELLPADHEALGQIVQCLTDGPLKGASIKLIGRADPRGKEAYNMDLGARRARSVAAFLEQVGFDRKRVTEVSRGELDAKGSDDLTWQIDRRVDIVLDAR